MNTDKTINEEKGIAFNRLVSGSAFNCDWCGKHFEGKPIIGGDMKEKEFCSWSCQKNDWEHYHDNWFSDADSGL